MTAMRLLLLLASLVIGASGCATTRSSVQIETRVHKAIIESDVPDYDLTARVCIDSTGVH